MSLNAMLWERKAFCKIGAYLAHIQAENLLNVQKMCTVCIQGLGVNDLILI